jgi:hypothetical protein
MTAPSGNVFDFKFRSTGGRHDDDCSRVTQINDGATLLVLYEYLGGSTVVEKDYTGIDVMQRRYGATSGDYPGFDRFNRIVEDTWTKDLATDVNIYDVDITYDRNSNITELDEVGVHVGFDAKITIDGLDRVTNVQEGTLSGGSLTSETREQTWTLMDQVGNWEHVKLDLNGDGDWSDADEYNDDRTYNDVNEIAGRDTDDDGTDNYTLTHDETGGLLDDGQNYEYKYDVWYRLRSISDQSQSLVSEFRYNGLAQRISEHSDTDGDGDVDVNDDWHHTAHDERWRPTAAFINTATSPRHEIAYDPRPGAIDQLVLWDNDTDDDGTLDSRHWYCQNRHDDVVSLITDSGSLVESTRYGPYGVPFGIPAGDANSDGDNDSTDQDQIQTWINTSAYDARGDVDLDGDVDTNDKSAANAAPIGGATLGRGTLGVLGRIRGWSGRPHWGPSAATIFVRHRILINGIWSTRDPEEYVEGPSMYEFAGSSPITRTDPYGLASCRAGQPETWPNKDDHGSIWSTVCGPSNDRWEYQLWATIIEPTTTKDGSCADSADKPCHLETGLNLGVVARPEGSSLPFRQLGVWGRDPQYQQSVIRQCEMWHGPGPNGRPNKKCKGGQITWGTFPPNGDRGTLPPPSESNGSMILDMSCSCLSSGVQCVSGVVIESNDGTCRLRANILFPCGACD